MKPGCLRQTGLPGTSRLFADFLYHHDRVSGFYDYSWQDPDAYRKAAGTLEYPAARRKSLVEALAEQNPGSLKLDLLSREGTVAVVTGQQVGIYGGPCYTIYKALTAARLAESLNQQGIPAVAVFWLATEDHDFEEVGHAWLFDSHSQPHRLAVSFDQTGGPVGGIRIAAYPNQDLGGMLEPFSHGGEISALAAAAYQPGRAMGEAFADLMRRLLGDLDLLYLDPLAPSIRRMAAPLLEQALQAAPELTPKLMARNQELEAAGYHAQVHVEAASPLFFLLENGMRKPLERGMHADPQQLSPNALLRPVMQDYLLPTVALIGGPAEIAYLAQSQVVYQALNRPAPVVVPRAGFTLLDARSTKLIDRYHLSPAHLFDGYVPLQAHIAGMLVPRELAAALSDARKQSEAALHLMESKLAGFDSTLAKATRKSQAKIAYQLAKIEAKTAREALRRDARANADAAHLFHRIYPNKHLQERYYSILPFLAEHGMGLIPQIRDAVHLDCPDHTVLAL